MRTQRRGHLIVAAATSLALLGLATNALAQDEQGRTCTSHKLAGLYLFSASGYTIVAGAAQPKAINELIRFNGDGTLTVPAATVSLNGTIITAPPGGVGVYTMEANCKGTLQFTNGPSFDIFASPGGEDVWMIQTNPNNVMQGNATRISR